MKWFWYSLIGFCVLMCSCKTKKVAHLTNEASKENTETNYTKYQALVDTSNVLKIEIDKSKLTITEYITITKYDKDTGVVTEKTETERKIAQDSDEVVAEEEQKRVEIHSQDSLNHFRGVTQKVESESETVTENHGLASVWERFGEVLGVGTLVIIAYLCWVIKSKTNQ